MILIEDDKLIHVDNAGDVIEHFGVKGMKWGQRRVVSNRGALRAQKKVNKLNKRVKNGFGNEMKDELASALSLGVMDAQLVRIHNHNKLDKANAKILSNKKGISLKDARKEIASKDYKNSWDAKKKYKQAEEKYGKDDIRTKRAKMKYNSLRNLDTANSLIRRSGSYVYDQTRTNADINRYRKNGMMYAGRYTALGGK
jgi:hypothetical protein|nr:MAG TPA: hypothetical protein [Caudoviricetes sp.]